MIPPETDEDRRQWAMLTDPSAEKGAGMMRYAAAMYFYRQGLMSDETLEHYRVLAKQDNKWHPDHYLHAIRYLVAEIEHYLDRIALRQFVDVRDGITRWKSGEVLSLPPQQQLACGYIEPALQACADPLAHAIRLAAPLLQWTTYDAYPMEQIGESFANGHAFASLIGEAAPIFAKDFDLGFFVIAPRILYRDHKHASPELYVPLTGPHGWRFNPGDPFVEKPAHEPVWNEPFAPHAMLIGSAPFLGLFCWTRDVNQTAEVVHADDWADFEDRDEAR